MARRFLRSLSHWRSRHRPSCPRGGRALLLPGYRVRSRTSDSSPSSAGRLALGDGPECFCLRRRRFGVELADVTLQQVCRHIPRAAILEINITLISSKVTIDEFSALINSEEIYTLCRGSAVSIFRLGRASPGRRITDRVLHNAIGHAT
jgi:hypothetical protein